LERREGRGDVEKEVKSLFKASEPPFGNLRGRRNTGEESRNHRWKEGIRGMII